ncbi:DNA polymerase III delta prime subunit [Lachnospiraceae bacterium KM106-2]|nr:DNA polymerase III delta prime subunit [Lachnospiraceae bacterium KM106-2]
MLDFKEIIGHESIIDHLQNAIRQDKVSHAYIFNGESGMGKHLVAKVFAKVLQCEAKGINPCNVCKSCMQVDSENQPDIIEVTHEKVSIGVDDIRIQVNNSIQVKPYYSPYKIYIIDDADKMTEQAQNALLKTIEEPPAYAIIILLTDNINRLLPTILSRCVQLSFKPVEAKTIKKYLMEQQQVPEYLAEISASFSRGNIGRAIRYATSEDFIKSRDTVLHVLEYIDDMELYEVVEAIKDFAEHKLEIDDYLDLMLLWYRDVLLFKVTNNPNLLLYKDEYQYISKQASNRDYENIEEIITAIDKAKVRMKANVNFDIAMELMLLTIKENGND